LSKFAYFNPPHLHLAHSFSIFEVFGVRKLKSLQWAIVWLRLRISNFLFTIIESIRTKAHQNNLGKISTGVVRSLKNFQGTDI